LAHVFKALFQKFSWFIRCCGNCDRSKYRTIAFRAMLLRQTLPLAGTAYVEMPAVMAKYNPFGEKAGMRKVAEQPPPREALKIAEILHDLRFNVQLLGSEKYVLQKLETLTDKELAEVREALIKNCHHRFIKNYSYVNHVSKGSLQELACLIKICGFLLQTKAYLFLQKSQRPN